MTLGMVRPLLGCLYYLLIIPVWMYSSELYADSASALISGQVSRINTLHSVTSQEALDLSNNGQQEPIASFSLSNNDPQGFQIKVRFENGGNLIHDQSGESISLDQVKLVKIGGQTIYTVPSDAQTLTADDQGGAMFIWSPEGEQYEATNHLQVGIFADWETNSDLAEGSYSEVIHVTVTSSDS
jgi:hypothetical protein